jgi:hypothetical protein
MEHSDEFGEIAAALAAAQGKMDHAAKDRTNPHFKSKYADLASVLDACRPHLSAGDLAIIQPPAIVMGDERAGAMVRVEPWLVHTSGQWFSTSLDAAVPNIQAQTIGSAITYLRRYGLAAMAGIAPEDDDGNAGTRTTETPPGQRHVPRQPPQRPMPTLDEAKSKVLARFPDLLLDVDQILAMDTADNVKVVELGKLYQAEKAKAPEGATA